MGAERELDAAARHAVPPHSEEAEQSVLGALLIDNAACAALAGALSVADFYDAAHGAIFGTIAALVAAGKPADVVTVFEAGGHDLPYLNQLAQCVPSARHAPTYARIVREHAVRRRVAKLARAVVEDAHAAQVPVLELIDGALAGLLELQSGGRDDEPQPLADVALRAVDDLQARADGKTDCIETGLADLDELTAGGARPGELWVLGARPSTGKSAFVLSLARQVGRAKRVLLLSMEDSAQTAAQRMLAAAGGVNLADIRRPTHAPESMWSGVLAALEELSALQVYVDDQPALTVHDVRRKVQQVQARRGPVDLVVIDFLQQMDGEGENRNRQLGQIAYGLQALGKQTGAWIMLLSQLSREADKRNGPPQMSDLRDSGDIEAAARWIGLLHRDAVRKPTPENKHWAQLHVCKQSNGPTRTIDLYFDGALQRFGNWSGPAPRRLHGGDGDGA
jgi:replicative DNA helicase